MAHTASLSQLQTPKYASVNGELVPYEDVTIHIGAEALTRALSVFEGLKGYWDDQGAVFSLRAPRWHYDRLCRSAALFRIPIGFSYEEYVAAMRALAEELLVTGRDLWFRTTLYVVEGHWGEATRADLVITAFTQAMHDPEPMRMGVSTWRRAADVALPARVKSSANYVIARLARIDANRLGYDDAVLLNDHGRVAEATGACVLIANRGRVVTPPTTEGCLDSITTAVLEQVCHELGVPFERRAIDRTELLVAEECGVAGTISELTLISEIDTFDYALDGTLARVRAAYLDVMRGRHTIDAAALPGEFEMVDLVRQGSTGSGS
ncbi:MAG: aminotransferase class IV [Pseudonocardia sp.]|nr:aminotransferase class IV [Pseudonocardia sp.]